MEEENSNSTTSESSSQRPKLIIHPPKWNLPSVTPQCIQLETFLKFASISYEVEFWRNPIASPSGDFPIFVDGNEIFGNVNDSISYITKKFKISIDSNLTVYQLAEKESICSLVENKLYYAMLWNWWGEEKNFSKVTQKVFGESLPFPLNRIVPTQTRQTILSKLELLDMKNEEKIYSMAEQCYQSLSALLGTQTFFFGEKPSSLDALVFGHLACHLYFPMPKGTLRDLILKHESLIRYCGRILFNCHKKDPNIISEFYDPNSPTSSILSILTNKENQMWLGGTTLVLASFLVYKFALKH